MKYAWINKHKGPCLVHKGGCGRVHRFATHKHRVVLIPPEIADQFKPSELRPWWYAIPQSLFLRKGFWVWRCRV